MQDWCGIPLDTPLEGHLWLNNVWHSQKSASSCVAGEEGHWDEHGVGHPSLCLGPDGLLRMLYHAFPNQGVGARILEDRGDLTRWKRI